MASVDALDKSQTLTSAFKGTSKRTTSKRVVIADQTIKSQAGPKGDLNKTADGQELTATNASVQSKNLLTKRASKPAYLQSLNESEKQANFKIIDSMNRKISYLKNPRHKVNKGPILITQAFKDGGDVSEIEKKTSFRVEPHVVNFVDYQVNGVYEIDVKVTNVAGESKRIKCVPPSSENFTIRRVKYPSDVTGDVAPGMSLTFSVSFHAPSFADFDDFVTFVTEENSFKLPLRARRVPPVINLVNPLNCLNSWLGDRVDMAFRCVNNGGDGGFKFFCDKDEDDLKQTDLDTIKIGPFTLTPSEFYLYSGTAIDIYVSFNPFKEGDSEEKLILACDNQTSEYYKVTGTGAVLDLDIVEVDGRKVDFSKNPFESLIFADTNPTAESCRRIKIRNSAPIQVPFHWSVYKMRNSQKISLQDEETHYRIEPAQGKFLGGETKEFTFFFCPQHAEPYFEYADMIVEDVPISAVRNPPEGLKQFAEANKQQAKVPMPTYVGSNTQFLSIPMVMFNLRGQGNSCKIQMEPPVTFFEGDLFINQRYTQQVKLCKLTQGQVKYSLRLEQVNRETFDVKIRAQGQQIHERDQVITGVINTDSVDLEISVESSECGRGFAYFYIEIEDGSPVTFSCQADFRGPILNLVEPIVDFGLTKVNTQKTFQLTLQNRCPIPGSFIIKNAKNKRMTFDNAVLQEPEDDNPRKTPGGLKVGPAKTKQGNNLQFNAYHGVLAPNATLSVCLTADFVTQETIEEYFEILVKDAEPLFFQVLGEVQVPKVYLNREVVELGKIYAGIRESVEHDIGKHRSQAIELVNYGNLPVTFHWEENNDPAHRVARFEPRKGTIPPKSKVKVRFDLTMFVGGEIDELFMCDIEDMEMPLGFLVKADAYGLNVAYMTKEEQTLSMSMTNFTEKANFEPDKTTYGSMNKLEIISFNNCQINAPSTFKFTLKNLSGIRTKFDLSSANFEPLAHEAPVFKTEVQLAMEEEQRRRAEKELAEQMSTKSSKYSDKKIKFAASVKSGAFSTKTDARRTVPILTDEHEQTQKFTSKTGNSITQNKALEKEQAFFLSNNKGIALVFNPVIGILPANAEVPITVTIYNNICGKFDDHVTCNVKGLPPMVFPVRISISGSPMVIPNNQVGLNYNTSPATLPMPSVVANTQPIKKTFKIKNTGIRALQVDWKIFDKKDLDSVDQDAFRLKIAKNNSFDKGQFPFKFNWSAVEPPQSQASCFDIYPQSVEVGSRQTQEFTVHFTPTQEVGNFKSIIIANPEVSQAEVQNCTNVDDLPKKGTLGVIALGLDANTTKPVLTLDKSTQLDGEKHVRIKHWAVQDEDAPSLTQKLVFSNDTKADLTLNFGVNGPFQIVKSKSNTGAKHPLAVSDATSAKQIKKQVETMFCLQPLKIVELHVKMTVPKPGQLDEWPAIIRNDREGQLVANFANGDKQTFKLMGSLLRPKVVLLTEKDSKNDFAIDEMDFGTVNVDKHRTIKVFLSNQTEVTAKWRLNYVKFPKKATVSKYTTTKWEEENLEKMDDPEVFEFSVDSGMLKGKSLPLRKVPEGLHVSPVGKSDKEKLYLPQVVHVNFRPKKNVLYKSKFRFTVENGVSCDVILKGKGSYEENYD